MREENAIKIFEQNQVRTPWNEEKELWYISVIDVIEVLTDSIDPQAYCRKLKQRLKEEGNEIVTNLNGLKMQAKDGKMRLTDVSDTFIKEKKFVKSKFEWQSGFGAFSYSYSALDNVIKYILNQKEHHKKKTFKEEYIEFLQKFSVEYKDEYLFEWIN